MSPSEMYKNLAADDAKIKIKRQQLEPKVIKKFKKTARFPVLELFEYTIPSSLNLYILYFYAENQQAVEKPVFDIYAVMFDQNERIIIKWGCSPYQHTPSDPYIFTPRVDLYSSHFFHRYKERISGNQKLSTNEVICMYFIRNPHALPMKLNEDIKRNYRKYGEFADYGMTVQDGICLLIRYVVVGYFDEDAQKENVEAIGCVYGTFLNHGMLAVTQKDAIQKENIRYLNELFKEIRPLL